MQSVVEPVDPKPTKPTLGEFMWDHVVKRTYKYPWPLSKFDGWMRKKCEHGASLTYWAHPFLWGDFWWRRRVALKAWTKQTGPFKPSVWKTKTYLSDWRDRGDEGVDSYRVIVDQYGRVKWSERMPVRMDIPYDPVPPQATVVRIDPLGLTGEGECYAWGADADGKDIVEAR